MSLEEAIRITEEHMETCEKDSEEYLVLEILLKCANLCKNTADSFNSN